MPCNHQSESPISKTMSFFPLRKQWDKWTLPSKYSAIGLLITILSFVCGIYGIVEIYFKPEPLNSMLTLVDTLSNQSDLTLTTSDSNTTQRESLNFYGSRESRESFSDLFGINVEELNKEATYQLGFYKFIIEPITKNFEDYIYDTLLELEGIPSYRKYHVTYPKITMVDNTFLEGKVNNTIVSSFHEYGVYPNDISNSYLIGDASSNYIVSYKIEHLVGIKFFIEIYVSGSAHGNYHYKSCNLDIRTGNSFIFKSLFKQETLGDLNKIIVKKLHEQNLYLESNKIQVEAAKNRSFQIHSNGISIDFFKYEVTCGACGLSKVDLSYDEIFSFIDLEGPLKFLKDDERF